MLLGIQIVANPVPLHGFPDLTQLILPAKVVGSHWWWAAQQSHDAVVNDMSIRYLWIRHDVNKET